MRNDFFLTVIPVSLIDDHGSTCPDPSFLHPGNTLVTGMLTVSGLLSTSALGQTRFSVSSEGVPSTIEFQNRVVKMLRKSGTCNDRDNGRSFVHIVPVLFLHI